MDPAELLKAARTRSDLTQTEVARRSGVDASLLSAYERGRRTPSIATLGRLLEVTGWQLHVELEPLHADLDRRIDELAALDPAARISQASRWGPDVPAGVAELVAADVPFAVTGPAAALLLGVPVPLGRVDLLVQSGLAAAERLVVAFRASGGRLLVPIARDEYASTPALYALPAAVAERGVTLWERLGGDRYQVVPTEVDPRGGCVRVEVGGVPVPVVPPGPGTGDPVLDRALARWRTRQLDRGVPGAGGLVTSGGTVRAGGCLPPPPGSPGQAIQSGRRDSDVVPPGCAEPEG